MDCAHCPGHITVLLLLLGRVVAGIHFRHQGPALEKLPLMGASKGNDCLGNLDDRRRVVQPHKLSPAIQVPVSC